MMALHSRLTETMFVLACALCAPGPISARAQDVTTASENSGKCPASWAIWQSASVATNGS
jgi:hypothetical protein